MADGSAAQIGQFTPEKKAWLAQVLAANLTVGNMRGWARAFLDAPSLDAPGVANAADQPTAFASALVEALDVAGKLGDAVAYLRSSARAPELIVQLQSVLRGEAPETGDARQKFTRKVQPLFAAGPFLNVYLRLVRAVCAIGIVRDDDPKSGKIIGSGFLIGPDVVMTNFHVVEEALKVAGPAYEVDQQGRFVEDPNFQIYAFFDYLGPPRPGFDVAPTHCRAVKALKPGWLKWARPTLRREGYPDAGPFTEIELDYAVVQLAEPIGERAMGRGGGAPRGWLSLPEGKVALLEERPLFVFQHPQAEEQAWDVGQYVGPDTTGSRAQYAVSAAHGSSGGATIDADGKLFALHVAEVVSAQDENGEGDKDKKWNQGVLIDRIVADLVKAGLDVWPGPESLGRTPSDYWSLKDDTAIPIIGRKRFREAVLQTSRSVVSDGDLAFVCRGAKGSGRRFSIALLQRLLGPGVPVAHLKPQVLAKPAREVAQVIAAALNIDNGEFPPAALPTEDMPRWWRTTLPQWLRGHLRAAEGSVALPAWVIVDRVLDDGEDLPWGDGVPELIRAMLGPADEPSGGGGVPELRWLFVGGPDEVFPAPRERRFEDLLPDPDSFQKGRYDPTTFDAVAFDAEFAECLRLAWWAAEPNEPLGALLAVGLAKYARTRAANHPYAEGAALIAGMIP